MKDNASIRTLRLLLLLGAIGWGIPVILLFFPKFLTLDILAAKGLKNAIIDPMIYYWLIMAFATWGIIGFLFLMSALHIKRYFNIIPLLAVGSLFQGGVLGVAGFLIKISINLFVWDVLFCLLLGGTILFSYIKSKKEIGMIIT